MIYFILWVSFRSTNSEYTGEVLPLLLPSLYRLNFLTFIKIPLNLSGFLSVNRTLFKGDSRPPLPPFDVLPHPALKWHSFQQNITAIRRFIRDPRCESYYLLSSRPTWLLKITNQKRPIIYFKDSSLIILLT